MKKSVYLLAMAAATVQAADPESEPETELSTIVVEGTKLSDVSGKEVKSADLAEALMKNVPSVSIVRRSGIANDIILRGQKKDNINILIDNAKVHGACPNRMDPPTSHVLTNNIEGIEITEGPYDVENFGGLSGTVKITTRKPSEEMAGELSLNLGSWNYRKAAATLSGGTERVRALVSMSTETGEQYEDGDGNNFAEQIENYDPTTTSRYKPEYNHMDAFEKTTFMGKVYLNVTSNSELMLSYTANRSDDVLYPSSPMDAIYDDSDIFNLEYSIQDLGAFSKSLDFQFYDSQVEHPMSNFYRLSSGPNSMNEKTHYLETHTQGLKIKNAFDLSASSEMLVGVDFSNRNWDGYFIGEGMASMIDGFVSMPDVDTENRALFVEIDKDFNDFNLRGGARYDDTEISPASSSNRPSNDYSALSGFLFGTYQLNDSTKLFGGIGRASRVPDARELYITMPMMGGMLVGTPDLDQTTNTEIDLGFENNFDRLSLKTKLFYSWLDDYIHYNASKMMQRFENVDATIYGLDISGSYVFTDDNSWYLDFGLAFQRGRKDEPLEGQTDRDLAEIPPLKANLGLNWDYLEDSTARIELIAADDWDNYDSDNGEQELDGYAVLNFKVQHALTRSVELTGGVDNILDETYAVSNTYKDLTLISTGADEVILMNEPGRYFYVNLAYRF